MLSPSILRLPGDPAPSSLTRWGLMALGVLLSSGGSHLCYEAVGPVSTPGPCKCLQVPRFREKRELPGSLWKSGTGGNKPRSEFQSGAVSSLFQVSVQVAILPDLWPSLSLSICPSLSLPQDFYIPLPSPSPCLCLPSVFPTLSSPHS